MALVVFGPSPLLVMALDGPVLALSDIMHEIAPGTEDDSETALGAESPTPEPLDNSQIELMRQRVLELIVSGASKMNTSAREKELLEMVPFFPCLSVWIPRLNVRLRGHSTHVGAYARCHPALHPSKDHTGTLSSARLHHKRTRGGTRSVGGRETRFRSCCRGTHRQTKSRRRLHLP